MNKRNVLTGIITNLKKETKSVNLDLEKNKDDLVKKSNKDLIDYLIVYLHEQLETKKITKDFFLKQVNLIKEIDLKEYQSGIEVLNRLKWLKDMKLEHTDTGLEENHKKVYEIFDKLNVLINNNNIDHYYTSGILAYTLTNTPLQRFHHDIDVFVNEKDLEKIEKLSADYNFDFQRKLGDRPDGTKRVVLKMNYKDYNIPITVFMIERSKDGTIIQNDYYYNSDNKLMVEKTYNSPECVELCFDEVSRFHNEIPYKSITLEALYKCKEGARFKDIYDCNIMKDYINKDKLLKLETALLNCPKNKCFNVESVKMKNFIDIKKRQSKGDDEIEKD